MNNNLNVKRAQKVSLNCITGNIILTIIKAAAGILAGSTAMIADSLHSATDIITTVFVILGIRISGRPADESHPYGHRKAEPITAKIVALFLMITAAGIAAGGIRTLRSLPAAVPGQVALWTALISIIVKEAMYRYTSKAGRDMGSQALIADAWHHRSDAMSSIAAFFGIGGALLGFTWADPVAAIVVGIIICKAAVEIYIAAIKDLMDSSPDKSTMNRIYSLTSDCSRVGKIKDLRARQSGNDIYLDLTIGVDSTMSVREGHDITAEIEKSLVNEISGLRQVFIHVEPL